MWLFRVVVENRTYRQVKVEGPKIDASDKSRKNILQPQMTLEAVVNTIVQEPELQMGNRSPAFATNSFQEPLERIGLQVMVRDQCEVTLGPKKRIVFLCGSACLQHPALLAYIFPCFGEIWPNYGLDGVV